MQVIPNEQQGDYSHPAKPLVDGVLCNCWAYSKQVYPTLPSTKVIHANLEDEPSDVAVFSYNGLPHYAVVERVGTSTFDVSETNFKRCQKGTRTVELDDPSLLGFYSTK